MQSLIVRRVRARAGCPAPAGACPVEKGQMPRRQPVRGFTLIEVLVSILLLSIGVLGMVGMQAWALRSNMQARYQASAVRLGRELGELMNSNAGVAALRDAASDPYLIDSSVTAPTVAGLTNCYAAAGCTNASDTAKWDIAEWYARANAELPGLRVVVCYDNTPFDGSGLPQWTCPSSPANTTSPVIKIGWTQASTKDGTPVTAGTPGIALPVSVQN